MSGLAEALSKARVEFKPVIKSFTAKAGTFSYQYADLAAVLDAVVPALSKHDLVISQPTEWTGDHLLLRTMLLHTSGEKLEATFPLPTAGDSRAMGSALTYARRYCLSSLLGIAAEADDDGAAAPETKAPAKAEATISKEQRDQFIAAAKLTGMPASEIKALIQRVAGVDKSDLIPASRYEAVMQAVAEAAA